MEQIPVKKRCRGVRVYNSGEIIITAQLAKDMNVRPGDKVALFAEQPKGSCPEIFLAKTETGIEVRHRRGGRKNQRTCCIYSKEYAGKLLRGSKKGIFRIGEIITKDGVNFFTIIYLKNYAV